MTRSHWSRHARHTATAAVMSVVLGCAPAERGPTSHPRVDPAPLVSLDAPTPTSTIGTPVLAPRRVVPRTAETRIPIALVSGMPVIDWTDPNGAKRRSLLDTGWADGAACFVPAGRAATLEWASNPVPATVSMTPLGSYRISLGRLAGEFAVGRHRVPSPTVSVGDGSQEPVLGASLLQYFC